MDSRRHPDGSVKWRIGLAWRELRRGASASKVKDIFYGVGEDSIDMALADALALISQHGPLRMGELADALHITPASTTRAVACLAEKGFVERVKCEDDQRSVVVSVTEAGRLHYHDMAERHSRGLDLLLADFNDAEQTQFADLLERYVAAVENLVTSYGPEDLEPLTR